MIGIQRSKGYATRPSFTIAEIKEMIAFVKEIKPDVVVFVDNCYGEFVEEDRAMSCWCGFNGRFLNKKSWWWNGENWWLYCWETRSGWKHAHIE